MKSCLRFGDPVPEIRDLAGMARTALEAMRLADRRAAIHARTATAAAIEASLASDLGAVASFAARAGRYMKRGKSVV